MNELAAPTAPKPYDVLLEQLRASRYSPGTVLTEGGLASAFGFSRTPIREALLRLEQDGLLVRTTRGMLIPDRTVDEVTDLYEVCMILEPEIAALVARRHRPHELLHLRDHLAEAAVDIDAGRSPREAFNHWHSVLWDCAHNPVLADTLRRLSTRMSSAPSRPTGVENWRASHAQHSELTDLVERFDAEGAAALMHEHLRTARDAAIRAILAEPAEHSGPSGSWSPLDPAEPE